MIERFDSPAEAAQWCARQRQRGASLGFVPTMGALHAGHLAIVERARRENDLVCASVFVNPLQFDDPADLAAYPRDFQADASALAERGCHMVFSGTLATFFPEADGTPPRRDPGPAAEGLEGAERAGHFAGVATIVARLFETVRPTRAYFGEKDFQQTLVVRHVARELARAAGAGAGASAGAGAPPEIRVHPTVREPSGLALSSRNARLSPEARERARALSQALAAAHGCWAAGEREPGALAAELGRVLSGAGLERVEYGEVRDPEAWTAERPRGPLERAQALVAARVSGVRLIDTLRLDGELPAELCRQRSHEPALEGRG